MSPETQFCDGLDPMDGRTACNLERPCPVHDAVRTTVTPPPVFVENAITLSDDEVSAFRASLVVQGGKTCLQFFVEADYEDNLCRRCMCEQLLRDFPG